MNFTKFDDIVPRKDILHLSPGRTSCICPRKEILHRPPKGHPSSAPERTPFFGSQTDTLHRPPNGAPASTPGGNHSSVTGKTPCIGHREETLHLPPDRHPVSATKRRPYIDPQKETPHRRSGGPPSIFHRTESQPMHPKGQHCISHGKETSHRPPGENHTSAPKKTPC